MKLADRRGNIEECSSGQDRLLEWIYTHETGRFLMKGLINPHISEIGAAFLDSRASRVLIAWFIRKNKIPMYQYEQKKYPDSCDDPDAAARRDAGGGRNGVCQQSAVCHLFSGL